MRGSRKYSIGLDIGTASVGWACLDDHFNVLRFRDKDALGVHLFEAADTAEARRLQRGMRRRYNRRIKRVQLLQEIFQPLIEDETFFARLNNTHRWNQNNDFENRTLSETLLSLGYTKEEINDKFPTIYHLRHALMNEDKPFDLRLVYLAVHNLVKFRGHFLLGKISWEEREAQDFIEMLEEFFEMYFELNEMTNSLDEEKLKKIDAALERTTVTNSDKAKMIQQELPKEAKDIGKLFTGLKFKLSNVFHATDNHQMLKDEKSMDTIRLSDDPENMDFSLLSDEQIELMEKAQKIFLETTLTEILGASKSIADAKVKSYRKNNKQLKQLKEFIYTQYGKDTSHKFFVTDSKTMRAYSSKPDKNNLKSLSYFDQYRKNKTAGKEIFFKEARALLRKKLNDLKSEEQRKSMLQSIENEEFLQFQKNISNASIPVQNSVYEAKNILNMQQRHHPEISETVIEKIGELISFRIPYYIGPLVKNKGQSEFAWLERKDIETSITPFNFEDVVDKGESASRFVRRMTNKCSYLLNEDVLPKHSLLYQEMEVLNELNGINVKRPTEKKGRTNRLSQETKDKIIEHHFKNNKKVSHKSFKDFMEKIDAPELSDGAEISGTQQEHQFASGLTSYVDFRSILGKEKLEKHLREVEIIILWITIFNEKSIIKEKLKDNFEFLSDEEIERVLHLDYKGWGRISEKALTIISQEDSIISLMRDGDYTFMEAYASNKHEFKEIFKNINKSEKTINEIKYSDIENLKCSPALRKSIWSAMKIIEELTGIFGEPESIILEFAREEGRKGRGPASREEQWKNLVRENQLAEDRMFKEMFEQLKASGKELDYSMEKIWLYLLQGGKCLYTQQRIDLNTLLYKDDIKSSSVNMYEVDHILPRSFVKDDSINNKALVLKSENQKKTGTKMPLEIIPENRRGVMIGYWKHLLENKMMNQSKYRKLLKESFDDQDKEGFIARQLVETRQISVHVRDLLEERFNGGGQKDKVAIEVIKAGIISEVRKKLNIPKLRNLNDHHHAIDALLVAGAYRFGNVISPKYNLFSFDFRTQKAKEKWKEIQAASESNTKDMNEFNENLFLITAMKKKEIVKGKTFQDRMKYELGEVKINVTRKTGSSEGAFYKQTIYSPKLEPAKYTSGKSDKFVHYELKKSFAILLNYKIKNNKGDIIEKNELVDTKLIDLKQNNFVNDTEMARYYAEKSSNSSDIMDPKVKLKIYKNDLIFIKGNPFYFISSGELVNAKQLELENKLIEDINIQYHKKWQYDKEIARKVYEELAEEVINQYSHLLPDNQDKFEKRKDLIVNYFDNTDQTYEDFKAVVDEIFKVTSASSVRSDKLAGRFQKSASFLIKNGKYSTTSITGLKYRKPKSLIKFLEH